MKGEDWRVGDFAVLVCCSFVLESSKGRRGRGGERGEREGERVIEQDRLVVGRGGEENPEGEGDFGMGEGLGERGGGLEGQKSDRILFVLAFVHPKE